MPISVVVAAKVPEYRMTFILLPLFIPFTEDVDLKIPGARGSRLRYRDHGFWRSN